MGDSLSRVTKHLSL